MKILALEFSSSQRGVAVLDQASHEEAPRLFKQASAGGADTHSANMVHQALTEAGLEPAQINRLAVGLGPGSYVGIRHALSFIQGWQLAHDVPVAGIPSTDIMATQWHASGKRGTVGIFIDAQREDFSLGIYELGEKEAILIEPMKLVTRDALHTKMEAGLPLAGPVIDDRFPEAIELPPTAETLAQMALGAEATRNPETLTPIYLRKVSFVKAPPPRKWGR